MMVLAKAMANDQVKLIRRARTSLRWSAGLAVLGLGGIAFTAVSNGWLSPPF